MSSASLVGPCRDRRSCRRQTALGQTAIVNALRRYTSNASSAQHTEGNIEHTEGNIDADHTSVAAEFD